MRATAIRLFLGIAFFAGSAAAGPITPICALHVDVDGNCQSDLAGQDVCVRGVVTAWRHFGSDGLGFLMDDVACGIAVDGIEATADFANGTEVEVCGRVQNVSGLAVIHASSVVPVGPAADPGFRFVSCFVITTQPAEAEQAEGSLVFACGTFDATGTFEAGQRYNFMCFAEQGFPISVYIDADTDLSGATIPEEDLFLQGLLLQTEASGTCTGWEIWPRSSLDLIVSGRCEEAVEPTTWGLVKSRYRDL